MLFSWEEEDESLVLPTPSGTHDKAYSHSSTRIEGCEGPIVDTGAFHNLSGRDSVERQAADAKAAGHEVRWELLKKPKHVSGSISKVLDRSL